MQSNGNVVYRGRAVRRVHTGILACLDPRMNVALESCEEIENGEIKNVYNETLIRGNNVLYISPVDVS